MQAPPVADVRDFPDDAVHGLQRAARDQRPDEDGEDQAGDEREQQRRHELLGPEQRGADVRAHEQRPELRTGFG